MKLCISLLVALAAAQDDLDQVAATDLLQQKLRLHPSCGLEPGIHLVKLPKLQRQFLFMMPRGPVESSKGIPVFMFFHGVFQTPYFSIRVLGLPDMLERYGWAAVLPFGKRLAANSTSMGGPLECCSDYCDSAECCFESKIIHSQFGTDALGAGPCGFWPNQLDQNLQMIDAIFDWMSTLGCIDTSKVFASGFSFGGTITQDLACARSWQFQGFAPDVAPGWSDEPKEAANEYFDYVKECKNATPTTYVSFCGSMDISYCFNAHEEIGAMVANNSRCTGREVRRKSATVNCTVWTGCYDEHVVESCVVDHMDHDVSGHVAPDSTTFLHPGSDLDFTKYIFEKFSLRVALDQLRFYGHPTPEDEDWKQQTWPPQKMYDNMYLREALAAQGMHTLPDGKISIASTLEFAG